MLFLILTFTDKFVTLPSSTDLIMPVSSSGSLHEAMGKEGSLFLQNIKCAQITVLTEANTSYDDFKRIITIIITIRQFLLVRENLLLFKALCWIKTRTDRQQFCLGIQ